mmetsp:Transcript_40174/g.83670  ORF Transcript_40174/g.83670 Transcript_40174/m.83670 type:complete len:129 (+) Transcript_40174:69-455(+)
MRARNIAGLFAKFVKAMCAVKQNEIMRLCMVLTIQRQPTYNQQKRKEAIQRMPWHKNDASRNDKCATHAVFPFTTSNRWGFESIRLLNINRGTTWIHDASRARCTRPRHPRLNFRLLCHPQYLPYPLN